MYAFVKRKKIYFRPTPGVCFKSLFCSRGTTLVVSKRAEKQRPPCGTSSDARSAIVEAHSLISFSFRSRYPERIHPPQNETGRNSSQEFRPVLLGATGRLGAASKGKIGCSGQGRTRQRDSGRYFFGRAAIRAGRRAGHGCVSIHQVDGHRIRLIQSGSA